MPCLYLAPWQWITEGERSFWQMPRPDIGLGCLDLRSLPQCGSLGPTPQGFGLFLLSQRDDTVGYYLGDSLGRLVGAPLKRALKTALSLGEDIAADTPLTILLELLNRYADPTGQTRWKPLRGSLRMGTRLSLMGREVWVAPLDPVVRANTVAVFRADYRRNKAEGVPLAILRKWAGSTMLKLWGRMSDDLVPQLLPAEYVGDGYLPPTTVVQDSFARDSDVADIDTEAQWVKYFNNSANAILQIIATEDYAKQVGTGQGIDSSYYYNQALSSDALYVQVNMTYTGNEGSGFRGPQALLRKDANTTRTYYNAHLNFDAQDTIRWNKVVAGAVTLLGQANTIDLTLGTFYTVYYEVTDGDNHTIKLNGSTLIGPTLDTSISNKLYTGLYTHTNNNTARYRSFEAGDLEVAGQPYISRVQGVQGMRSWGGF